MIQNRLFQGSMGSAFCFLMAAAYTGFPAGASELTSCTFQFDAVAETAHGTISSGETLKGQIKFTLARSDEEGQSRDYPAKGEIIVSGPDGSELSGKIRFVRVTRSPAVADSLLIDARDVSGNLGQVKNYFDPMLFAVYGKRGMLSNFDLPRGSDGWNAFNMKRVFQYQSPGSDTSVLHQIGPLKGGCT
jgi:hypothetical protein